MSSHPSPYGAAPEVSVIICTFNRPELLKRALDSVLDQDFSSFEVIVVDDGSDEPVELSGYGSHVRVARIDHTGTGAARAAGLNAAGGRFVAYCDDDDEWMPGHLGKLHDYLVTHPEIALVYGDSIWATDGTASKVAYSSEFSRYHLAYYNYIFATDVMHRADVARSAGGFDPTLLQNEDWDLWLRMARAHEMRHVGEPMAIHHWHEGCVSNTFDEGSWWRPTSDYERWAASVEPHVVHGIKIGAVEHRPFDPATWSDTRRELIWHSMLSSDAGYSVAGRELLLALERQGVDVRIVPTMDQAPKGFERFADKVDHWGRFAFYYDVRLRPSVLPSPRRISYSMWESTEPPRWHVEEVNRFVELKYVPCTLLIDIFRDAGVEVPIKVLHHGVDAEAFRFFDRRVGDAFVFGTVGDLSPRKGIDVLLRAFEDEFAPDEPVKLILKSTPASTTYHSDDPRVSILSKRIGRAELVDLLGQMHAFVMPSRGEGFGLCGLEAMSTGLPVIATNWSGPADYLADSHSYPLSFRLSDAGATVSNYTTYHGLWAEPDYEHLRALMRAVYEDPDAALAKGKRAAEHVRTHWTWDRVAAQLAADLDELA